MRGYRLASQSPNAPNLVAAFFIQAKPLLYKAVCKQAAVLCAYVIDQRVLELPPIIGGLSSSTTETPLTVAYRVLLKAHRQAHATGIVQETDIHLTLYPSHDDTLILLQTQNEEVVALWEAQAHVEPFQYLRTPDMTDAEWAIRSSIWDAALVESNGYKTECFGKYGLPVPHEEDILSYVPIRKERARVLGTDRVFGQWLRRQVVEDDCFIPATVLQGIQWLHGEPEANAAIQDEAAQIEPILPMIDYELLASAFDGTISSGFEPSDREYELSSADVENQ